MNQTLSINPTEMDPTPMGWGAGQPGFPCKDGVVGENWVSLHKDILLL